MDTYTNLGELYDRGNILAQEISNMLSTQDGHRVIRQILNELGIDSRTQRNLSIPVPRKTIEDLTARVESVKSILEDRAISNRNIMQAIEYAEFTASKAGKSKKDISDCLIRLGFEIEQFHDKNGWLGLKPARKIVDALALLIKDPEFGINMGKYASETNVLKEAKMLARFSKDISTFLYLSSGLTKNYFNNCWGTTTLPIQRTEIEDANGIEFFSADVIWSDVIGVRPTYHEWGYTYGLFEKAMFKVLKYFERVPHIFQSMHKKSQKSKELERLLKKLTAETLSHITPITSSVEVNDLLLSDSEGALYKYSIDGLSIYQTSVDDSWVPIGKTRRAIGEIDNDGKFKLNDILFSSETSAFSIEWYETKPNPMLKFIQKFISAYVESKYRKERFKEIIADGAVYAREKDVIEIARLNNLVRQQELELSQALEAASANERLAAIGLLGASFAHEVNNPLAAAGTHMRVAKVLLTKDPTKAMTSLESAIASVDHAKSVVTDFRSSTTLSDEKQAYLLNSLCDDALKINPYTKQGYTIVINYQEDLHKIYCNKTNIIQLLTNLFNNSFEAMKDKEEKQLTITTASNLNFVYLKIQDTGGGIGEEYKIKLFTPFFTTKRHESTGTGGTGLGLYRCKKIVEGLGGEISFENYNYDSGKKGVIFTIKIPYGGE
ncbi:HAMP domain-containing histidine kinase [Candidatus Woesearchaeota archaeon]|nr:HAMP domain-containing histidine kinase [Candidatus Woesearchaeota archaeon]